MTEKKPKYENNTPEYALYSQMESQESLFRTWLNEANETMAKAMKCKEAAERYREALAILEAAKKGKQESSNA